MILPNIETFIGCESSFEEASIVLYGAPFDSTTSFRPGARFGPSAMRHESFGLETYSPYQDKDLIDISVFDSGDLELCFGSSEMALSDIQKRAEEILKAEKFPLLLGGEHLVTLGAVRAAAAKYPDLHIIHFDAHADLRDDYLGAKLSHACVLRRCHEIVGDGHIHQFCIRSGEREEFQFASRHTDFHPFTFEGLEETVRELKEKQVPVYFTIDLDCMDPSVFPGTGTPEAGGVSFLELLKAIRTVSQANLVGADVNMVRSGIGSDTRIGRKFLYPGIGYGGSCFPKDVKALIKTAEQNGYQMRVLHAVEEVNELQKSILFDKLCKHFNNELKGKTIALWGLAFKPETDDMREAPSLVLIDKLLKAGCKVRAYDSAAMDECRRRIGESIYYAKDMYDAVLDADALMLVTEWKEFRLPSWAVIKKTMEKPVVLDGRNIYDKKEMEEQGFTYHCIGH